MDIICKHVNIIYNVLLIVKLEILLPRDTSCSFTEQVPTRSSICMSVIAAVVRTL